MAIHPAGGRNKCLFGQFASAPSSYFFKMDKRELCIIYTETPVTGAVLNIYTAYKQCQGIPSKPYIDLINMGPLGSVCLSYT